MTNILVTGGNGFIGSHLVDGLAREPKNHITVLDLYPRLYELPTTKVSYIQGNLSDINLARRVLEDGNIQVVYHTAWATIAETALKNVFSDIEINLQPTINLLEACRDFKVQRIIYLSSGGAVYGKPEELPINEDHPTNPINPYGITKLTAEKYVQMYAHLYGMEYVILRPSVPYGPRQNPHRRQGVISTFIYNALKKKPVTVWGDGDKIIRDYFYISDLIHAMILAKDLPLNGKKLFNLSGSACYSLNEVINSINLVLGVQLEVNFERSRDFDVKSLHLDINLAKNLLGWEPLVTIEDGIVKTAKWIEKNIE
ncbi:MAG: NAD-dependent epimerase/dehydratase family protein [Anaerolineae bacterium]|jgi:UDP-glucose 4-epimerase|nr:NAD-dependent epimerase/dehydratase family protein [Anaerolineae bacterium]